MGIVGIALPIKSEKGRMALLGGDRYITQIVMTALGDSESENPFQSRGFEGVNIFDINDGMQTGELQSQVEAVFAILERDQLASLVSVNFSNVGSDRFMDVQYKDLETGNRIDLQFGGS